MGWTGEYRVPRTYAEEKARIEKMFTWDNTDANTSHRVAKICNVRPNWYVAIEVTAPAGYEDSTYTAETLPDGRKRYTFAVVVLCHRYRNEWTHKEIEESSGPNESAAPASFLAMLSPLRPVQNPDTPLAWAHAWRARCAAHAKAKARKLTPGMILKAPYMLSFGAHGEARTFKVMGPKDLNPNGYPYRAGQVFAVEMGMVVSLRPATLRACEVIA